MLLHELEQKKLIYPPSWLSDNCHYLCLMGSVAYGVSSDTSDNDIYGWAIPPKSMVFRHLSGYIDGFGTKPQGFDQFQAHHIKDKEVRKSYDLSVYSIVKFFELCRMASPNIVDALFVPSNCVLSITQIGQMVRENRRMFLHKGCWHTFKGYAFQQMAKVNTKKHEGLDNLLLWEERNHVPHSVKLHEVLSEAKYRGINQPDGKLASPIDLPIEDQPCQVLSHLDNIDFNEYLQLYWSMMQKSTRAERVKLDGTDRKFLYHVLRLMDEVEQILTVGDIDLQRAREQMKAIRRGEMTEEQVKQYFADKEKQLEQVYQDSKLPYKPDEGKIRTLLYQCLEHHYGSLDKCVVRPEAAVQALKEIKEVLEKNRDLFNERA
jgi:predicted nucleotidyltransferase